jgi:diacylglycerol kinase (ATP)
VTVHLVANPAAGGGGAAGRIDAIAAELAGHGAIERHVPDSSDDARALLAELAADGVARVVVAGGDGMIHLAVNALAKTETVLGIVPVGTGNDAVKGLGLPTKMPAACAAAMGPAAPVDLIECDSVGDTPARYAMTVAIVGLAVNINERAEVMRFPKGGAKYSVATLAELPRIERHELTVTVDGVEHDVAANLLAVANLAYFGGGMKVAPEAKPTDGSLEVVLMGPAGPLKFGALLPTVFTGHHVRSRHVAVLRGAEVRIEGAELRMRADGETWGSLPATLRAAPGALRVAGR